MCRLNYLIWLSGYRAYPTLNVTTVSEAFHGLIDRLSNL